MDFPAQGVVNRSTVHARNRTSDYLNKERHLKYAERRGGGGGGTVIENRFKWIIKSSAAKTLVNKMGLNIYKIFVLFNTFNYCRFV